MYKWITYNKDNPYYEISNPFHNYTPPNSIIYGMVTRDIPMGYSYTNTSIQLNKPMQIDKNCDLIEFTKLDIIDIKINMNNSISQHLINILEDITNKDMKGISKIISNYLFTWLNLKILNNKILLYECPIYKFPYKLDLDILPLSSIPYNDLQILISDEINSTINFNLTYKMFFLKTQGSIQLNNSIIKLPKTKLLVRGGCIVKDGFHFNIS